MSLDTFKSELSKLKKTVPTTASSTQTQVPSSSGLASFKNQLNELKGGSSNAVNGTPYVPQERDSGSFLGEMVKGLVSAPLTMLARPIQLAAEAIMPGDNTEAIDRFSREKLGGFVAPVPQGASDVIKDVGRAGQTVALGLTAPGTVLSAGAGFGLGTSLEQQGADVFSKEGITKAAFDTATGMASGKFLDVVGRPLFSGAAWLTDQ